MTDDTMEPSSTSIVKRSRITLRPIPKKFRRKSTGLCKCGASRTNPKDAYCLECRRIASARGREKRREELQRLRALEDQMNQLLEGKEHGQKQELAGRPQTPAATD